MANDECMLEMHACTRALLWQVFSCLTVKYGKRKERKGKGRERMKGALFACIITICAFAKKESTKSMFSFFIICIDHSLTTYHQC